LLRGKTHFPDHALTTDLTAADRYPVGGRPETAERKDNECLRHT
jgi:hypothetical protein